MNEIVSIFWFRKDLRITDNPGLFQATQEGKVLPIYIFEDTDDDLKMGAASRWWLHYSLTSLHQSLGGALNIYKGNASRVILDLIGQHKINSVYWNRCYDPLSVARDTHLKALLKKRELPVLTFNASLLWEPWEVLKTDRKPYQKFTPFYQHALSKIDTIRLLLPTPKKALFIQDVQNKTTLEDLKLLSQKQWETKLQQHCKVGEAAARQKLTHFLKHGLCGYQNNRDYPDRQNTSKLSPHFHFGEISPSQVWHALQQHAVNKLQRDSNYFLRELVWREFSYSLLYHFPHLPHENFQKKFDRFRWRKDTNLTSEDVLKMNKIAAAPGTRSTALQCRPHTRGHEHQGDAATSNFKTFQDTLSAWKQGKTGYPIIDAGMRELWQTGIMHNRVRMIVASFLVKNLLIHWKEGAAWFWDTLVDADLANNSANWQWVAGSGTDAPPYFRIFNPILQGEKFDKEGAYTCRFVPELRLLPKRFLFKPWEAPQEILQTAGVILGETYPYPIVDIRISRQQALEAYHLLEHLK